jgi:hypothetical protein
MNSGTQFQREDEETTLIGERSSALTPIERQATEALSAPRGNHPSHSAGDFAPDYVALKYRRARDVTAAKMATGLGWFSIALGLAELLAPRPLGAAIGVGDHDKLLPALGLREIASGVGILTQPRPAGAVWSRVGGDAMDLALLGAALLSRNSNKARVLAAIGAVAGVTALDYICAQQLSEHLGDHDGNIMAPTTEGQPSGRRASSIF